MATTVGTEDTIQGLVTSLIYLERQAIAAYKSTIEQLSDESLSAQVEAFRQDHLEHLSVLLEIAAETGAEAPAEGDMKEMLTMGKVALAGLMGNAAILNAMKSNEDDTVAAYERASTHPDAMAKSRAFFERALDDELRHRKWMRRTSSAL